MQACVPTREAITENGVLGQGEPCEWQRWLSISSSEELATRIQSVTRKLVELKTGKLQVREHGRVPSQTEGDSETLAPGSGVSAPVSSVADMEREMIRQAQLRGEAYRRATPIETLIACIISAGWAEKRPPHIS